MTTDAAGPVPAASSRLRPVPGGFCVSTPGPWLVCTGAGAAPPANQPLTQSTLWRGTPDGIGLHFSLDEPDAADDHAAEDVLGSLAGTPRGRELVTPDAPATEAWLELWTPSQRLLAVAYDGSMRRMGALKEAAGALAGKVEYLGELSTDGVAVRLWFLAS